jgi:hypothetical protein
LVNTFNLTQTLTVVDAMSARSTNGSDAKKGAVSNASANPPLPDASRKNVLLTLDLVRGASRSQKFSQNWLQQNGVGQSRQAMRLLRFLGLLDNDHNLALDVVECRAKLLCWQELLLDRVQTACTNAGFTRVVIERLGSRASTWSQLKDALLHSPPVSKLKPNVQNNVLGCLKSLDEVLRHLAEDGWLDGQVRSLAPTPSPSTNGSPSHGHGLHEHAPSRSSTVFAEQETILIPYAVAGGRTYWARIAFDGPATPEQLRLAGLSLQRLAEAVPTASSV